MDEKESVASMYLIQAYLHSLRHEFSDRVITAVLERLFFMPKISEGDARDLAENIHLMMRTVAA